MIFLFKSTHDVIMAEKKLKESGINFRIIPAPKSISSDCGMSIEVQEDIVGDAENILKENDFEYSKVKIH